MPEQPFRFGVGSPDGPRSAVWSLISSKHDAYVIATEAGAGVAKVSFHLRTGEFSWGYTREHFAEKQATLRHWRRDFQRWHRPPQVAPGFTLPLRICVANEALRIEPRLPKKHVNWYQPRPWCAISFVFLLSAPTAPEHELLQLNDLQLIKRLTFTEHDESMGLYVHHTDATRTSEAANRAIIAFTSQFGSASIKSGSRIYAQWQTPEPGTGSRNIMEVPTYFIAAPNAG